MARILKVRLSKIARAQAVLDLSNTYANTTSSRLNGKLAGLPIYTGPTGRVALANLSNGRMPEFRRVGWRYVATFEDFTGSLPCPATADYARSSGGTHRCCRIDHSAATFVNAVQVACRHAASRENNLRFAPRLLLYPVLRWSAVWMAERHQENDFFVVDDRGISDRLSCLKDLEHALKGIIAL
ncbi:hypothetical protein K3181_01335 [Qipengyuania sp. YG27]|uniref:Uncharacterized protein n=1 Tax=Qipengyuania mesophila TaxID=2867246 RepID=A0ABS7JR59_9SPHN|nr:hypothetical protein [Qipengyuania mesophila]MBX7500083.1 hypothetical protein [Qipengyuania mesophila]